MTSARSKNRPPPRAREKERPVWTSARVAAVCARHAAGTWLKHACALEGGSYDGLRDAMASDPKIREAVALAHAQGSEMLRKELRDSARDMGGDWKREAWMLERWDQETFHLTTKVEAKNELTGKDGAPLIAPTTPISMADRKARALADLAAIEETTRDLEELEKGKTQ